MKPEGPPPSPTAAGASLAADDHEDDAPASRPLRVERSSPEVARAFEQLRALVDSSGRSRSAIAIDVGVQKSAFTKLLDPQKYTANRDWKLIRAVLHAIGDSSNEYADAYGHLWGLRPTFSERRESDDGLQLSKGDEPGNENDTALEENHIAVEVNTETDSETGTALTTVGTFPFLSTVERDRSENDPQAEKSERTQVPDEHGIRRPGRRGGVLVGALVVVVIVLVVVIAGSTVGLSALFGPADSSPYGAVPGYEVSGPTWIATVADSDTTIRQRPADAGPALAVLGPGRQVQVVCAQTGQRMSRLRNSGTPAQESPAWLRTVSGVWLPADYVSLPDGVAILPGCNGGTGVDIRSRTDMTYNQNDPAQVPGAGQGGN